VKALGIGPLLLDRYRALGGRILEEDTALARRRFGWGTVLSLVATGVYYGVYATMVLAAAHGSISIGEMTLYAAAFRQGQQSFESILSSLGGMHEHSLYLSNLYGYFDRPASTRDRPPEEGRLSESTAAHLVLEDVSFKYPGAESWALRHVSLDIPSGKSLALVGFNGAGKTTLIKLILGLYEPTEGKVLLDGRDLATVSDEERRQTFSVVFQDFARFQMMVRGGDPGRDVELLRLLAGEVGVVSGVVAEVALVEGHDVGAGHPVHGGVVEHGHVAEAASEPAARDVVEEAHVIGPLDGDGEARGSSRPRRTS
jgi:ATP-binding cassette subfamily B protein